MSTASVMLELLLRCLRLLILLLLMCLHHVHRFASVAVERVAEWGLHVGIVHLECVVALAVELLLLVKVGHKHLLVVERAMLVALKVWLSLWSSINANVNVEGTVGTLLCMVLRVVLLAISATAPPVWTTSLARTLILPVVGFAC
jgi:hypothetical protein